MPLPTTTKPKYHPLFNIAKEDITFLVGDTLFQLPAYFFKRDSVVIRRNLENSESQTGTIPLKGITAIDFERFVRVLFPTKIGQYDAQTTEEWKSILLVADLWQFEAIRTLAIEKLTPIAGPVDKIVLGEQFRVPKWINDGYYEVCFRQQAMTMAEGEQLGVTKVIAIADSRQRIRSPAISVSQQNLRKDILAMFNLQE